SIQLSVEPMPTKIRDTIVPNTRLPRRVRRTPESPSRSASSDSCLRVLRAIRVSPCCSKIQPARITVAASEPYSGGIVHPTPPANGQGRYHVFHPSNDPSEGERARDRARNLLLHERSRAARWDLVSGWATNRPGDPTLRC